MENKKQVTSSLDHLFSPKNSSSSSSSTTSDILSSIFPPPPTVLGKDSGHSEIKGSFDYYHGLPTHGKSENPEHATDSKGQISSITDKDKSPSIYQNQTTEPCYFSSSIHYGGRENYYSPRNKTTTDETHLFFRKEGDEDDLNGDNCSGASRGNWWQGSLYY